MEDIFLSYQNNSLSWLFYGQVTSTSNCGGCTSHIRYETVSDSDNVGRIRSGMSTTL